MDKVLMDLLGLFSYLRQTYITGHWKIYALRGGRRAIFEYMTAHGIDVIHYRGYTFRRTSDDVRCDRSE